MPDAMLVVAMMLVTFIPRFLPFALAGRLKLPPLLVKALSFVPIAILTAIVSLHSVVQEEEVLLSLDNFHLLAAVVAAVVAYFSRRLGFTVAIGLATFFLLRWVSG